MAAARRRYCMRMVNKALPGDHPTRETRMDVCGLDAGHTGDHQGQYRRMRWNADTVVDWGSSNVIGKGTED